MQSYKNMLEAVLDRGEFKSDRTGTGTQSLFGYFFTHDLSTGFPLLTTKRVHFKSVAHELLWMISGDTNVRSLNARGVTIWDEWAGEDGDLGPVYGSQWRSWGPEKIDQLRAVVDRIRRAPDCRRLIVTAWNPSDLAEMALPPCHCFFQFGVSGDGRKLSCLMYQRSADLFLGVPFNIASYALLTHLVAHATGLEPGTLTIVFGDLHIYNNHRDQVAEQLSRECRPLPQLKISSSAREIDDFKFEDLEVVGYFPHPAIKAEVSV